MAVAFARSLRRWLSLAAWFATLALAALPLQGWAQDDKLPGHVGRVANIAGELFLSPEDHPDERTAIGVNYPIMPGGILRVPGEGRVEIDYGGGQFRLGSDTSVNVSRLDDRQLVLFIAQGGLIIRVRALDPGDAARVDTPNTQIALTRAGLYRIDVTPDRHATTVTVREGEAEVALASGAQRAHSGETVVVNGAASIANVRQAPALDDFDVWSANRDRPYDRALSAIYVPRQMVEYADLDEYGSWQSYPDYGPIWFPTSVAPGWAPYQDGYWTDVGVWAPTWVDLAPWGYAPLHHGRWAHNGGRWGWRPGTYTTHPAWAPALVPGYGGKGWGREAGRGAPVHGWPSLAPSAPIVSSTPALSQRSRPQPAPIHRPSPPRALPPIAPSQPAVGISRPTMTVLPVTIPQPARPAPAPVTPMPAANAPSPTVPAGPIGTRAGGTGGALALPQAGSLPLR